LGPLRVTLSLWYLTPPCSYQRGRWLRSARSRAWGSCAASRGALEDCASFVQRGFAAQDPDRTFIKGDMPVFRERDEFENFVDPKKVSEALLAKKHKSLIPGIEFNPFKDLVSNINSAIDSVKDGLETSTREVVHKAAAEMKDVVQQTSNQLKQTMKELDVSHGAEPASFLEVAHKPKMQANETHNSTHSHKKKHKKSKIEFNPFKDLISGINQAIDVVKDGIETTTRDIVHESAAELSQMGRELSKELEAMQQDVVGSASAGAAAAVSAPPASLLSLGGADEHKPKKTHFQLQLNITSNSTHAGKKKHKANKTKIEFNPFKEMISSINGAIDSIKDNLEASAHDLVHSAAAELEQAGRELKNDMEQTVKQTIQDHPVLFDKEVGSVAASSQ